MEAEVIKKLLNSFPGSVITCNFEFVPILHKGEYFMLENCKNELDVKCKVLEWLSRASYKTNPYRTNKKNNEIHEFMLSGINKFLGTDFTKKDMEIIYQKLGNAVNHELTMKFIIENYDMDILKEG